MDPANKERVFAFLDSAYRHSPSVSPEDLSRLYGYKRHYYYETRKDYGKALKYADSEILTYRGRALDRDRQSDYGRALFAKGDILMVQKKYRDAFLYFYQGKMSIEKTGDTCSFGEYTGRLGVACYQEGRYREGMGYFKEAIRDFQYCKEKNAFIRFSYTQGNLDNIALCYRNLGMTDSALFYYDSALRYISGQEERFRDDGAHERFVETARGVIYGNQGDAWLKKGDTAEAEALFRESIRIDSQPEHAPEDAQLTMIKLARLYKSAGRLAEAGGVLAGLRQSLDSLPGMDVELQWRQLQWNLQDELGHTKPAYEYLQSYMRLKDSMAMWPSQDINEELRHISQEYELDLLRKSNELKTGYLAIAVFAVLMVILILLLVWQNWRKSRKNVEILTRLNRRIRVHNVHMQKALEALEQSQQENTRIMKVVTHDLRNPIGAMGSVASIMLKRKDLPKDMLQMLQLIRTSSDRSLELISDLLHMYTAPEEMTGEEVDLQSVLQYGVDLMQFKAEEKKQHIYLHVAPATVWANREKLWRVLSNLITNAIKFSPEHSDIIVEMVQEEGKVRISVKDEGIGIPGGMKESIFDLSGQVRRRGTAGEESFGLGLNISRRIVEAHGGRIWFESEVGRGTTFYIELPVDGRGVVASGTAAGGMGEEDGPVGTEGVERREGLGGSEGGVHDMGGMESKN